MKLLSCIFSISLGLSFGSYVSAQPISPEQMKQIDSLFADFEGGPPVAYGIIYHDEVFRKEFGKEPYVYKESRPTQYHLGSMAVHFTAYAILLLEERGKIDLDDDISQYLGTSEGIQVQGIMIKDLLNHSHGLPDYWSLKSLAGYTAQDRFTTTEARALFSKSLESIHTPRERVFFSGTGPYLLARVLEKVTGKDLYSFTQEQIFAPLNMKHTYFIHPGFTAKPIAYVRAGDNFEPQWVRHMDNGPAGLLTTMEDLMIWFEHLSDSSLSINHKMDQPITFQEQKVAEIANGKITYGQQFLHDERGINTFWDYGQIGGFASCVFRFPTHHLTIITLSKNGIYYNGYLGMHISEVLLKDDYQSDTEGQGSTETLPLSENLKKKFVGSYFDSEFILYRKIIHRNDTLFYYRPDHGDEQVLFPISQEELEMRSEYGNYRFSKVDKQLQLHFENTRYLYEEVTSKSQNSTDPKELIGRYLCENWSLILSIVQDEEGNLVLEAGADTVNLYAVDAHRYVSSHEHYRLLTLDRNTAGGLERILVSHPGFKDLVFKKVIYPDQL